MVMKRFFIVIFLVASYVNHAQIIDGDYFVAPPDHPETPGNDMKGNGSFEFPWATFHKAFRMAKPGDTVYFKGGIYLSTESNIINPEKYRDPTGYSGTRDNPICYFGYPPDVQEGNMPILDCRMHCDLIVNPYGDVYNSAISISYVEFIHFKDLEIRNVFQCDPVLSGAITASHSCNLTFEHIIIHDIGQRGFWIQGGVWNEWDGNDPTETLAPGYWGYASQHPDTTRWINCDVYNLCDSITITGSFDPGNGADAWKTIHYKGNYVSWEGCRAWNYSDDAFDPTGKGGVRVFDKCWVMASKKYKPFLESVGGSLEGNGFKATGVSRAIEEHAYDPKLSTLIVRNCVATYCKTGFKELDWGSYSRNRAVFSNNTAIRCDIGFSGGDASAEFPRTSVYSNNIAYASTGLDPGLKQPYEVSLLGTSYTESHNTWEWKNGYPWFRTSDAFNISEQDFSYGLDSATIVSLFTAPRQKDGSLPSIHPFSLDPSSELIDAGTDVGLPYIGSAPDIGAFEYGSIIVEIIEPSEKKEFIIGDEIIIKALANDPFGEIIEVKFYIGQNNIKLGDGNHDKASEWQFAWESDITGNLGIRAVAINSKGESATSSVVNIFIYPEGGPEESENNCKIVPNPNNGTFVLELVEPLTAPSKIHIISMEGRLIAVETMVQNEITKAFDLSSLGAGYYGIVFNSGENIHICNPMKLLIL